MRVGRFSRPLGGVGVLAMPNAWPDTTQRVESVGDFPPDAGVLRLLVPGVAVGVFNDRCSAVDRVEVMH